MSDDPINSAGLELIKRNEGCKLRAYPDVRGIPTIGVGHTGPEVHLGLVIDQARADELLRQDLGKFEAGVADLLDDAETGDNQYSAMICLAFNIGLGDPDEDDPKRRHGFAWSSVLRFHKAGQFESAANAFRLYNKSAGRYYAGLARRREEERALYLKDDE